MNRQLAILLVCLLHFTVGFASTFTLSVEVTPNGAGSLNTSSGTYEEGSSVYLRTYNNTGYVFKGWYESDTLVSSSKSFYYTMPAANVQMQARYEYDPAVPADPNMPDTATYYKFAATVSPVGAGSVNVSSGKYTGGSTISLRAYTNTGYKFSGWKNGSGELLSSSTSYSYTMPYADTELTALYTYNPTVPADPDSLTTSYTLSLQCKPTGSGSFNISSSKYAEGDNVHLYAYTNTGYKFVRWEDTDGNVLSTSQNFYYVMPHGDTKLYGIFEYDPTTPANPGANHWDAETGEVIMDDYSVGYLRSAIDTRIGGSSNRSKVSQITVSGKMNSNDFGLTDYFTNCTYIDLSRTGGYTEISLYAFDNSSALTEILLPSCVESIGYCAFYNCTNLTAVTCYATTPPTVGGSAFEGISDGAVLYVPAVALSAYQEADGWKDAFSAILPITSDVCAVEVNLPAECADGRYKDMTLELVNTVTGQKHTYVINDRIKYVFNGLVKKSSFNAYLRNQQGVLLGEIDGIQLQEEDVAVTFTDLLSLYTVRVKVSTPDGTDITGQMQAIQWMDASGDYLSRADSIIGQVEGTALQCKVTPSQDLGMKYKMPDVLSFNVSADTLTRTVQLAELEKVTVTGKVKSTDGSALSSATLSVSQKLNGLYTVSSIAKTDNSGAFSIELYNEPTSITVACSDYVSQTVEYTNFTDSTDLGQFALKEITGAVITTDLTYTESVADGETAEIQNWYSDYANVAYSIYNQTTGRSITQFNTQYPQIVLLEEVAEGDKLKITATSKTSAFVPVEAEAVIDSVNRATATFPIVELGAIKASFTSTDNASVVGLLYDSNGQLMKKYSYSEAELDISSLQDGDYTLVTMTNSTLFNSILNLSQYAVAGLTEGTDYVKNTVTVKSGVISAINNASIPVLDESKLYYTGDATSFTVNKTSITSGNYLTLRGKIDFKDAYTSSVSGVKMVVDLPESCSFVENSVMVGSSVSSYTLDGNRITIPLDNYSDQVRFCIIPTEGGSYAPSAFANFTLSDKEITQPIGNANFEVKNLSISVPSTVAKTSVAVTGTAPGKSAIKIYDSVTLIGETTALANGAWSAICELNEPYNLSTHSIYAKVTTTQGMELKSETHSCLYDMDAIEVSSVTMLNISHRVGNYYEEKTVFDFQNPAASIPAYWYWPAYPTFTFLIDFTNNDTTKVSDVVLYVKTCEGNQVPLNASYDDKKQLWVASGDFGSWSNYDIPANVSLDYDVNIVAKMDSSSVNRYNNLYKETIAEYVKADSLYNELEEELSKEIIDETKIEDLFNDAIQYRIDVTYTIDEKDRLDKIRNTNDPKVIDENVVCYGTREEDVNLEFEKVTSNFPPKSYSNITIPSVELGNGSKTPLVEIDYPSASPTDNSIYTPNNVYWDFDDQVFNNNDNIDVLTYRNSNGDNIKISIPVDLSMPNGTDESFSEAQKVISSCCDGYLDWYRTSGGSESLEALYEEIAKERKICVDKNWEQIFEIKQKEGGLAKNKEAIKALVKANRENNHTIKTAKAGSKILSGVGTFVGVWSVGSDINEGRNRNEKWRQLIDDVKKVCDKDVAVPIKEKAEEYKKWINRRDIFKPIIGVATTGLDIAGSAAAPETGGLSLILKGISLGGDLAAGCWKENYTRTDREHFREIKRIVKNNLKCKDLPPNPYDDDDSGDDGEYDSHNLDVEGVHDPSGYVYEAVVTNRLEGVKATCYYKETVEDMYGDFHENVVMWDAAEYAQENPLFTDENGMYRWDVPQGLWQVKFEKDGYETTYSDWLPVPPPQLEVNIAMTQLVQPRVLTAYAYENAIDIEFDKYMDASTITTERVRALQDNTAAMGHIVLQDAETVGEQTFVKNIRFELDDENASFALDKPVTITVSRRVESYAGKQMLEDFTQEFDVKKELTRIVCDSAMSVIYGDTTTFAVTVMPVEVSAGQTLQVSSSSSMILQAAESEITIDDNGQAYVTVIGALPGTSVLTFSVADSELTATTILNVAQKDAIVVATPTASIASGTEVDKGTVLTLSCTTEGATIYYTTDGSCPCDVETAQVYDGTPIVINETVTIKAMAAKEGMYESDVAEFNYTVTSTSVEDISVDGELEVYPLPVRDKLNISAGGKVIRSVQFIATNGATVMTADVSAREAHLNTSKLPAGLYILNVTTKDKVLSQKVMRVGD